jgi:hypothetical protein
VSVHHPDCDGFRMHAAPERQVSREGRGVWQAECRSCSWTGNLFGNPVDAHADGVAHEQAADHDCHGECQAWA